jgi:hypothetical protein
METLDFASGAPPSAQAVHAAAAEMGLELSDEEARELAGLVGSAAASAMGRRIAAARAVGREYPFALTLGEGEQLLTGVIDLLAEEADGSLVVDYKSDRVGPEMALEELVEREYAVQRLLYALAVLRSGAQRVQVVHWFLARPGEPAVAVYGAADLAGLEQRLTELAGRARAGVYEVSPMPHRALCETCPGRRGLCSWGETETMRADPLVEPKGPQEDQEGPLRLF